MNKTELAVLQAEIKNDPEGLGYSGLGQNYPAIADLLNKRPELPNPEPQQKVPKQWTTIGLLPLIQPDEAWKFYNTPKFLEDVEQACLANNRDMMMALFGITKMNGLLSQMSQEALLSALAETEPDPSWTPTILGDSRATILGLPFVQPSDVQQVR